MVPVKIRPVSYYKVMFSNFFESAITHPMKAYVMSHIDSSEVIGVKFMYTFCNSFFETIENIGKGKIRLPNYEVFIISEFASMFQALDIIEKTSKDGSHPTLSRSMRMSELFISMMQKFKYTLPHDNEDCNEILHKYCILIAKEMIFTDLEKTENKPTIDTSKPYEEQVGMRKVVEETGKDENGNDVIFRTVSGFEHKVQEYDQRFS